MWCVLHRETRDRRLNEYTTTVRKKHNTIETHFKALNIDILKYTILTCMQGKDAIIFFARLSGLGKNIGRPPNLNVFGKALILRLSQVVLKEMHQGVDSLLSSTFKGSVLQSY